MRYQATSQSINGLRMALNTEFTGRSMDRWFELPGRPTLCVSSTMMFLPCC